MTRSKRYFSSDGEGRQPEHRAHIKAVVDEALSALKSDLELEVIDGETLAGWQKQLHYASLSVDKWLLVRFQQQYSKQKKDAS